MASETVDPIDWSHTPPSCAVPPERHVLHDINAAYKSHDVQQQHASTGVPDQRTAAYAIVLGFNIFLNSPCESQDFNLYFFRLFPIFFDLLWS